MLFLCSLVVIGITVYAIVRRIDVRLVLFLSALTLSTLASAFTVLHNGIPPSPAAMLNGPMAILRTFLVTLTNEQFVVPICTAMGFAYVLRLTECDQHLVKLLVEPLRKVRFLLIPGTVVVGFLVNIPVVSQASTAVTVGAVLIPLLLAARLSPVTIGSALMLGASLGGELLNPGAPELRTVVAETRKAAEALGQESPIVSGADCVPFILPLALLQLAVVTPLFWMLSLRAEARAGKTDTKAETVASPIAPGQVNLIKALVPLVPLALLVLTSPGLGPLPLPVGWLVQDPANAQEAARFDSRLIGVAMLIGVAVAGLVGRDRKAQWPVSGLAVAFFEGAGYAFANIISVIVAASCFGKAVEQIGLADLLGKLIRWMPALLLPLAGGMALAFAALCGSGMAATQSLFGFFADPALQLGIHPGRVGAVVSLAAAAGRTMSPVAAVVLLCSTLTKTSPIDLARRVALPLLAGIVVVIGVALLLAA
jgi:C4-dicarboxylate transporter, DcuC family